jgi:hypothetical protein
MDYAEKLSTTFKVDAQHSPNIHTQMMNMIIDNMKNRYESYYGMMTITYEDFGCQLRSGQKKKKKRNS